MGKVKALWQEEYENMHPEDAEFAQWVASMEQTYAPKLAVTTRTNIKFDKRTEEYSPYATVNS